MRRRAAGRADGRPGLGVASCTSSRAAGRTAVLGAVLTVLTGVVGLPAAQAEPGGPVRTTAAAEAPRPVRVVVQRLEPRTVVPGAPVQLGLTLVNDGTTTYRDLSVRLQRGDVLRTRAGLDAELDSADTGGATAAAPWQEVAGELAPGQSRTVEYATTAEALQLTEDGVYPVLVNVNGRPEDGAEERVGELATQLVSRVAPPADPPRRTTVAWLWPITDRPHRDPTGAFVDDQLAAEVAEGGRLDRALDVLDRLPRVPGGTRPAVPVTLAVDPALLEELAVMAAGPYRVGDADGTGTAAAAALLERLRAAADPSVVVLPYADVDGDALAAGGLTEVLARSLPGTPEGTARQPGVPGATEATTGSAGAAIVRDVLGVEPRTDVAWPVEGAVRPDTLAALRTGGARAVVLAQDSLTEGDRAVGAEGGSAVPASSLPTAAGPVTALVADQRLTDLVTDATGGSAGGRLTEQSFLAELGALATQAADAPATLLVVPSRRVDPDPATVAAMMTDTVEQPWLTAVPVPDLVGAGAAADAPGPGPAGDLVPEAGTDAPLSADDVAVIAAAARVRDDFTAAVGEPASVLAGYDAAIARAASAGWRGDPVGFTASAARLRDSIDSLRRQVTLVAPVDGTYSLASRDAPLVLTVRNDLPFPIDVELELITRENVQLTTEDIGVTTLEPESRRLLEVPARVQQSGGFAVTARLTTPGGELLGEEVRMQVRSTAYGPITLGLTIGAAGLLGLLFLRRAVLFVLARRRGETTGDESPAGGAGVPPTRSPV
ncbi:DUF6049 family protein [Modestobacter sp. VKM Ac-2986]|uniref:DUF6049 family protein n=1 Tax=Modestobacter sp. VKM Ac-2986 TaxID=3004140 RepID=UPI0022AAA49D|nr:DUF6049 family protein [Modestobacter sp. VKM Ac-2986]MCZ2827399.1 DUF6049 family protein [Modestobacter sp. VKM Ac-2986]